MTEKNLNNNPDKLKVLETEHANFRLENGLLFISFPRSLKINLEVAKELTRIRLEFTKEKSSLLCINGSGVIGVDSDVRNYISKSDEANPVGALALVLDTYYSKLLGNIFINLTHLKIPTKIFTKKKDAVKWLAQFK